MIRVPRYDWKGWECWYEAGVGHRWRTLLGTGTILVRHWGRRLTVQRTLRSQKSDVHPAPYGNPTNGGEQGGPGIELHPRYDRVKLDGTIERHAIGWWREDGTPYFPGTRYVLGQEEPTSPYAKIDGSHYVRAFGPACRCEEEGDPVGPWWLDVCAADVMRRWPLAGFTDAEGPEYSLFAMKRNVELMPGLGALGICRELAWGLRCVVESQRVRPTRMKKQWIGVMVWVIAQGQAANGAVERHGKETGLQQGEPWGMFGLEPGVEVCTSWQVPFLVRALREALEVVPELQAAVRSILRPIKGWWLTVPMVAGEDGSEPGLPRYLVVARDGKLEDVIQSGVGPARPYYDEDAHAVFADMGV